jgi:hypothetical protein
MRMWSIITERKLAMRRAEVIREIFTPKETRTKVNNPHKQLFPSPAEEYFTPKKHDRNKRKHTFLEGAPARIEK